jgi:hypothetical protein
VFRIKKEMTKTERLIWTGLVGVFSAILQSAGGLFPGIGYVISPLATAPIIMLCLLTSVRNGVLAYVMATFILVFIQPSELIIYPFTTGVLGIGLGIGVHYFTNRMSIIICGAFFLWCGILFLLYGLDFPVLGPFVSSTFNIKSVLIIWLFSMFYSWLWTEAIRWFQRKLRRNQP